MNDLIINQNSRQQLEAYLASPTHALLLTGRVGVGLGTIARRLGKILAGAEVVVMTPTLHRGQTTAIINVDDIRSLAGITRSRRQAKLVIVIDESERMARSAPEAFLKQLEEPNQNIHFILTSHNPFNLPRTILSRVQQVEILLAAAVDCRTLLDNIKPPSKRTRIEFMATGRPAEISRLLSDETYYRTTLRNYELAKAFLSAGAYDRLRTIAGFKKRDEAAAFLDALANLLLVLSEKRLTKAQQFDIVAGAIDNLAANGNIKAQLTNLAVNLP